MEKILALFYRFTSLIFACMFCQSLAQADVIAIDTPNASGWVMEDYSSSGGFVVIWQTGAVCANNAGFISLPNPSPSETNRLWSVITASKLAGARIFVRYNNTNCLIESFGFR